MRAVGYVCLSPAPGGGWPYLPHFPYLASENSYQPNLSFSFDRLKTAEGSSRVKEIVSIPKAASMFKGYPIDTFFTRNSPIANQYFPFVPL